MDEGRGKRHGQMATWYLKHCSGISNCATKSQTDRSKSRRRGFGACIRYKRKDTAMKLGGCWEDRRNGSRIQSEGTRAMVLKCWDAYQEDPEVPSPRPPERYRLRRQKQIGDEGSPKV